MRTLLLIVAMITIGGCAETRDAMRATRTTPIVTEQPSLSARRKFRRQFEEEQAFTAMTKVDGAITR